MVSDEIKAARIQAQYSPLINSTWPGTAFQANVRSAVRHATGWLSPHRGGRPVGRTFTWALGDIAAGGDSSFVTEAVPGAVTYRITVVSYDVVSGPVARESR